VSYAIKEIFLTLQGEARLPGASPYSAVSPAAIYGPDAKKTERARNAASAIPTSSALTGPAAAAMPMPAPLVDAIETEWGAGTLRRFVVLTGGEPLLQVDDALVAELHARGFEIGIETNGTLQPVAGLDWICVSPKAGTELTMTSGDELKLVYPQPGAAPEAFEALAFRHFSLQPMDGPDVARNTEQAIAYCLAHPRWRLSVQTHKVLGLR